MKVCVFGGNEDVGGYILKQLNAAGYEAVTMAETENSAEELKMLGAAEVIISEAGDFSRAFAGADAIIYIAGASINAAESQDALVDHDAVSAALEEAEREKVGRFVYLSAVRMDEPEETKKTGGKHKPEEWMEESGLNYTVIRTSKAVSKPGKGTIEAAETVDGVDAEVPYEDIAAAIVESLDNKNTFRKTFEMTAGETGIKVALDDL
ncbi:NAD(P)H-binding protein [Salinicoccus roseus]|uniref:NAD(P)-binding domain-containing protein n=1 Tax=Salinicoccus roseus TaxID=45670 RepID=A0A265E5P2_9STAP|nr:NAD(P)H-binding protein [Salinicoccus roseus]MCG7332597.1 NAD(P)H-binding protein [Salinicoccus roseus]OZT76756.1 hypothetical protein CFN03_09850 [Salinicoccus roseus]RPE51885.1 uncharacterized protein YbjT (DUF2867 family) [Salinicoccus roseus]GGA75297.1 oxidoreductase [Salinicoccus roseus]